MKDTVRAAELLRRRLGRRTALLLALAASAAGTDIGRAVVVTGDQLNIGENSTLAEGAYAVIGRDDSATGQGAVAIGSSAMASGLGSFAMGIGSKASGDYSFAAGRAIRSPQG